MGRDGESFQALNGNVYNVTPAMCVIADDERVLGLGGVIGGELSGVSEETTDILVECALFDPTITHQTGRALTLTTDAQYRFARGVDSGFVVPGLELATRLILDLCGGEPSRDHGGGRAACAAAGDHLRSRSRAPTRRHRREADAGARCAEGSWLRDQRRRAGLEEAAGAAADLAPRCRRPSRSGRRGRAHRRLRQVAADRAAARRRLPPAASQRWRKPLALGASAPPLRSATTKPSPGVSARARKRRRSAAAAKTCSSPTRSRPISIACGLRRCRNCWPRRRRTPIAASMMRVCSKRARLMRAPKIPANSARWPRCGARVRRGIGAPRHQPDIFDVKRDVLMVLEAIGAPVASLQTSSDAPAHWRPGRTGALKLGPKVIAYYGEIHPRALKAIDVEAPRSRSKSSSTRCLRRARKGAPSRRWRSSTCNR